MTRDSDTATKLEAACRSRYWPSGAASSASRSTTPSAARQSASASGMSLDSNARISTLGGAARSAARAAMVDSGVTLRAGSTGLALEIVPDAPAVLQNAGELPPVGAERVQIGFGQRTGLVEIAHDLAITPLGLHENERRLNVYVGHLWNGRPWRGWELVSKRSRRHDHLRESERFSPSRRQFRCVRRTLASLRVRRATRQAQP